MLALKPADDVRLATHAHARAGVAAREGSLERGLIFVDTIASEANATRVINALAWFVRNGRIALHDSKYRSVALQKAFVDAGLLQTSPRAVFADK